MARRRMVFAGPADFMDMNGVVIELGMRVSAKQDGVTVTQGEVCMFDEDSSQPIGVVLDLDSYSYPQDIRWFSPEEIEVF